jgi:hypothetical protein
MGRADADGVWLRSVTEVAESGMDVVERLVERVPTALLCIGCFPGIFLGRWCRLGVRCAAAVLF